MNKTIKKIKKQEDRNRKKLEKYALKLFKNEQEKEQYLKKLKEKNQERQNQKIKKKSGFLRWFSIFNKYTLFGVIAILISIIINILLDNFYGQVISSFLQTIGIALLLGAIFDYSKNSQAFMELVSNILKEIVVSKNFLNGLEAEGKKQALDIILRPSGSQLEQCSALKDYFNKKIDSTMELFNTNFKTNLVLLVKANVENGRVVIKGSLSHRIYRIQNDYYPIITSFERTKSGITKTRLISPDGHNIKDFTEKDAVDNESNANEIIDVGKIYEMKVPEEFIKYPYLNVQRDVYETGYNHWTAFSWTSLTPCDGIYFRLECHDGLHVKSSKIFDDKSLYNVSLNEDNTEVIITSVNWLDKFTGFSLIVSNSQDE